MEISSKSSSGFGVARKLFKISRWVGLGRGENITGLGGFGSRYVTIDVSIWFGEYGEGMERSVGEFFTSQIVDACGKKSREILKAKGSGGSGPINKGRIGKLLRKGRRPSRLNATEYRACREALRIGKVARG
jgi:hypothetical protein